MCVAQVVDTAGDSGCSKVINKAIHDAHMPGISESDVSDYGLGPFMMGKHGHYNFDGKDHVISNNE